MTLRAPFTYFGGKGPVADAIWQRLGTGADAPRHYVEPFAGSLAVLLGRPGWHPGAPWVETVNDLDGLLCNVWRALALAPAEVERHASHPVIELDLHARHAWLRGQRDRITDQLRADPEWCDPRAAGWWLWGACCWLGSGWGSSTSAQLPEMSGQPITRLASLPALIEALHPRLTRRVVCGDWRRVVTDAALGVDGRRGLHPVAVYLDPDYCEGTGYAVGERGDLAVEVWAWAVDAAARWPALRIAVSGYDDGREVPAGWDVLAWRTTGGFANQGQGQGRINAARERVWFSPGCLAPANQQIELFTTTGGFG